MFKKTVSIFGRPIELIFDDEFSNENWLGYYDPNERKISIRYHNPDEMRLTILHEYGHAKWDRLSMNQTSIPHEIQEIIIENFCQLLNEHCEIRFRDKEIEKAIMGSGRQPSKVAAKKKSKK